MSFLLAPVSSFRYPVLNLPRSEPSDIELIQAAKDVISSQDALIVIFQKIEGFFKRLEAHADAPMTEAVKDVLVKIMVEVLEIFTITTKEIRQAQSSESIPS